MEQLKIKNNIEIDYQAILSSIKANPIAIDVIKKLNISDDEIKNNYEIINAYIMDNINCHTCHSYKNCQNGSKGMHYGLIRDELGMLSISMQFCPFYKDYYKKEKNIVYSTFKKESIVWVLRWSNSPLLFLRFQSGT